MKKFLNYIFVLAFVFLSVQNILATEYGQVVRIQCERTGQYLAFDADNDVDGTNKIIVINDADDNGLWIVKGALQTPVSVDNPYDRWSCVLGDIPNAIGYDARLEHLKTGLDAHIGVPDPDATGHVMPHTYNVGPDKQEDSSAFYYYSVALNSQDAKQIAMSNEYLCAVGGSVVLFTQDSIVDTWNIIPVAQVTDDIRDLQGEALLAALDFGSTSTSTPDPDPNQPVSDHLIEDVTALIDFYNNETTYSAIIKNAFTALVSEPDLNERINIVQALDQNTMSYNNQKIAVFGSITHTTIPELTDCINSLLIQSKAELISLENDRQVLDSELTIINNDLTTAGATSVTDLTTKVDQLVAALDNLWE